MKISSELLELLNLDGQRDRQTDRQTDRETFWR